MGRVVEFDEPNTTLNDPLTLSFTGVTAYDYFVAIRQRNHLDVMTPTPLNISDMTTPPVDFTDGSQAANNLL